MIVIIISFQFGVEKDLFGPRFLKNITLLFQNIYQCPQEEKVCEIDLGIGHLRENSIIFFLVRYWTFFVLQMCMEDTNVAICGYMFFV